MPIMFVFNLQFGKSCLLERGPEYIIGPVINATVDRMEKQ